MQLALIAADSSGFLIPCQLQGFRPEGLIALVAASESVAAQPTTRISQKTKPESNVGEYVVKSTQSPRTSSPSADNI